jgi:hypothetical protein
VGYSPVTVPTTGVEVPVTYATICVLLETVLTTVVFPVPKLPVTEVAVITAVAERLPVPLIPTMLSNQEVVEVADTDAIVVSGTSSPVAYTALTVPVVGGVVPPNAESEIEEVSTLVI